MVQAREDGVHVAWAGSRVASCSRTWRWRRVVHVVWVTATVTREQKTVPLPGEVHQQGPRDICCVAGLQVEEVHVMDLVVGDMVQIP